MERTETRRNSKLLKDIVIALPDDKELNLDDRIEIIHRIVKKME
ncbi:MobA/MobL family protein [Candidatus Orientia mediorientalis]|nr:MobA/MobL family protein [Candidatus Orientia mediorientalis]